MRGALLRVALLAAAAAPASGSANGLLYVCDPARLTSESLCYFVASATNSVGASPHGIDTCVAADGLRKVVGGDGADLRVTPKPWTQGDVLAASPTEVTGDTLAYAKAFELVAPLRDMMMYDPGVLKDAAVWDMWTKPFVDCKIKEADDTSGDHVAFSRDNVYATLVSTTTDNHHKILQFLEEGAIDLVCLMTSLSMDRCDVIRAANGVATTSSCWEAAYSALQSRTTCTSQVSTGTPTTSAPAAVTGGGTPPETQKPSDASGARDCTDAVCPMVFVTCDDGSEAPVSPATCCPHKDMCSGGGATSPPVATLVPAPLGVSASPVRDCTDAICPAVVVTCDDGSEAPVSPTTCCPHTDMCSGGGVATLSPGVSGAGHQTSRWGAALAASLAVGVMGAGAV